MDDAMDCLMSFSDFLFAFQIQFYYSGESLPGPSGSCRDLTPRPALGPAVCVSGPHVSAPPPCVAGFPAGRPAGCPVVAGGHTTRPAGPTRSLSLLVAQKTTALPASRGTHQFK